MTGRRNDQFNLGGVKLNAQLIDFTLINVDGVRDAISFLVPVEGKSDRLTAILCLDPEADVTEVLASRRKQHEVLQHLLARCIQLVDTVTDHQHVLRVRVGIIRFQHRVLEDARGIGRHDDHLADIAVAAHQEANFDCPLDITLTGPVGIDRRHGDHRTRRRVEIPGVENHLAH